MELEDHQLDPGRSSSVVQDEAPFDPHEPTPDEDPPPSAGAVEDAPPPVQKRKGGRKPIYATSEERKQRNRQAQAAFRERRTEYIKQLEVLIKQHEDTIQQLQQNNRAVTDECLMLRYRASFLERVLLEKGIDLQAELGGAQGMPASQRPALQSQSHSNPAQAMPASQMPQSQQHISASPHQLPRNSHQSPISGQDPVSLRQQQPHQQAQYQHFGDLPSQAPRRHQSGMMPQLDVRRSDHSWRDVAASPIINTHASSVASHFASPTPQFESQPALGHFGANDPARFGGFEAYSPHRPYGLSFGDMDDAQQASASSLAVLQQPRPGSELEFSPYSGAGRVHQQKDMIFDDETQR